MAKIVLITFLLYSIVRYSIQESVRSTTEAPVISLSRPPDFFELLTSTTPSPTQDQKPFTPDPIDWASLLSHYHQANQNVTTFSAADAFLPGSDLTQSERTTHHISPASSAPSPKQSSLSGPRKKKRPRPTPPPSTTSTTTTTTTTRPPKYYISDPEDDDDGGSDPDPDDDPPRDIYAQFSDSDPQHYGSASTASNRAKPLGHHRRPPYYYSELASPSTSNIDNNYEEDLPDLPQDSHYNVIRPNHYYHSPSSRYPSLPPPPLPPSRDVHDSANGYYQPSYFLEDIHRQGPNGDRQTPGSLSAWSSGITGFLLGIIPLSLLVASIAPAFMSVPVGAAMAAGAGRRRRRKRQVDSPSKESLRFLFQLLEKNPLLSEHLILQKMNSKGKSNIGMT